MRARPRHRRRRGRPLPPRPPGVPRGRPRTGRRGRDSARRGAPRGPPARGSRNAAPGSASAVGTRTSGPAITDSSSARSPTLRASGPLVEVTSQKLSVGHAGTRPSDGRSPTTPQNDAGLRSEPPMSEPSASGTIPARRAHAAPPLEPPAERVGSTGLRVVPKTVLNVCEPAANSGTLVLPMVTAPAVRIRSTTSSSASGTWSAKSGEPYVVRHPATSWVSLNANGRPWRGPSRSPAVVASSAAAALRRARSSSSETIALSSGLRSAIRARCRSSSSRAEICFALTAATISRAVESTFSSTHASHLPRSAGDPCVTAAAGRRGRRRRRRAAPARRRRRCPSGSPAGRRPGVPGR